MLRPEEVLGEMEVEQGEAAKKWNSSQCSQPVDHLLTGGFSFICGPRPSVSGVCGPILRAGRTGSVPQEAKSKGYSSKLPLTALGSDVPVCDGAFLSNSQNQMSS